MNEKKKILYADDDLDDKTWIVEAWQGVPFPPDITFVDNGRQVLEYLQAKAQELPALIVLDLNMPELDGRQTLQKLKADAGLASIPVAIVTTSTSLMDKEVCKKLGADLFLTKPDLHSDWVGIVQQLETLFS